LQALHVIAETRQSLLYSGETLYQLDPPKQHPRRNQTATMAGVKTIIVLSFVCAITRKTTLHTSLISSKQILAIGFILVILSSALYHNFLTLLVVATYVLAPVPNWICSKAQSNDDFMDSGSSSIVELGRFLTGFFVVMGMGMSINMRGGRVSEYEQCVLTTIHSTSHSTGTHSADLCRGNGNEHYWWSAYLRHHHQLHHVLPRAGGVLVACTMISGFLPTGGLLVSATASSVLGSINVHLCEFSFSHISISSLSCFIMSVQVR
jgi:hypothetical protein